MVNGTARAPLFVRPFTRGYEKQYSEGDILFVKKDERSSAGQHHVVANIPVLNYLLRTELDPVDSSQLRYQKLEDVLKDWNYYGIFNNDMDTGSKWQRLLNVNVRGRSRVARLWQPKRGHLRRGDCVWIGFIERKSGPTIKSLPDPNGSRVPLNRGTTYYEAIALMDCCDDFEKVGFNKLWPWRRRFGWSVQSIDQLQIVKRFVFVWKSFKRQQCNSDFVHHSTTQCSPRRSFLG
jgi:hypothetical protein